MVANIKSMTRSSNLICRCLVFGWRWRLIINNVRKSERLSLEKQSWRLLIMNTGFQSRRQAFSEPEAEHIQCELRGTGAKNEGRKR